MIEQPAENRVLDIAPSDIGRAAGERQRLELLEDAFQQIRIFCHDFSQPLMVLSGYLELITFEKQRDNSPLRDSHLEGLEQEVQKLGGIYQKLRNTVIRCRQQIDLTNPPPSI